MSYKTFSEKVDKSLHITFLAESKVILMAALGDFTFLLDSRLMLTDSLVN